MYKRKLSERDKRSRAGQKGLRTGLVAVWVGGHLVAVWVGGHLKWQQSPY